MTGLSVDITADTRQFQAEVENVPAALSKISENLNTVTKSGDKAGASIESSMRTAQSQTAETEQVFRGYTNTVVRGNQTQSESFALTNREVNKIQKEGLKATGSAMALTVEQSAQAFDGTVSGALSALQGISTGIAVFGGPQIALAAGAASLLVAGISGAFQKSQADIKLEQQTVSELTAELEKLGKDGSGSVSAIDAKLKEFSTTTDGSQKDLTSIRKTAEDAGIGWTSYARALAGSTVDQERLYAAIQKQIPLLDAQAGSSNLVGSASGRSADDINRQRNALLQVSSALREQNDTLGQSKHRVDELAAAQLRATKADKAAAAAQKEYTASAKAAFDDIGSTLAGEQQQISSGIESAQKTLDSALKSSHGRWTRTVKADYAALQQAEAQGSKETAQSFIDQQNADLANLEAGNDAKIQIYKKFGKDAAAVIKDAGDNTNLLSSLAGSSPDQVAKIMDNYSKLGNEAATNFARDAQLLLDGNPLKPKPVVIPVSADTSALDRTLADIAKRNVTVRVNSQFGRQLQ